jgi:putative hemolysin
VFCEEQGGTVDIRSEDDGSIGYCVFGDGAECEEWAFYRGECAPSAAQPSLPNPASVFCEEQGGTVDIRTEDGGSIGYCVLSDGTECEEWAFYRGECVGDQPPVLMSNPATEFCKNEGGVVEVRSEEKGSVGYCIFSDGTECEVWAFWSGACAPASEQQSVGSEDCHELAAATAQTLGVEVAQEEASFQDYVEGGTGVGCQVTASGTGLDFESILAVSETIKDMMRTNGWNEDPQYLADGPTGTATAFRQDSRLCLFQVGWAPSEDAGCPADRPATDCDLTPEQQIYTVALLCGQDLADSP